jgi:hypothetical protein
MEVTSLSFFPLCLITSSNATCYVVMVDASYLGCNMILKRLHITSSLQAAPVSFISTFNQPHSLSIVVFVELSNLYTINEYLFRHFKRHG